MIGVVEAEDCEAMKTRERQSLTTRQLADSLGVSESSVKRWIDDGAIPASRTAGGHRRIPMAAAVRFMRRQRMAQQRDCGIQFGPPLQLGPVDDEAAELFHAALLDDDVARARAIITGRYVSGADIAVIGDRLIRPALERLGELWKEDAQGILVEHRAVDTCIRAAADVQDWTSPTEPDAPVTISASGPDDPYVLPPLLASMTLQEQGGNARNLGPGTPLETIVVAAKRYGAVLCSVSVSTVQDRKRYSEWISLADSLAAEGTSLVVGGRCAKTLPAELLGRVRLCGSMVELGSFAAGVVQGLAKKKKATKGGAL